MYNSFPSFHYYSKERKFEEKDLRWSHLCHTSFKSSVHNLRNYDHYDDDNIDDHNHDNNDNLRQETLAMVCGGYFLFSMFSRILLSFDIIKLFV